MGLRTDGMEALSTRLTTPAKTGSKYSRMDIPLLTIKPFIVSQSAQIGVNLIQHTMFRRKVDMLGKPQ